ncbi:MAG: hypothetical protein ACW98Y_16260 [Candidatus Thorarchaeota archaeon]|jgi:hypothetical protein
MAFGSKYFGWIATLGIVLAAGWFLLPAGYETLILWLSPQLGNYIRPTLVLVNIILVDPLTNLMMLAIWGIAGFIGGVIAGTKKGAFVVGLFAWLTTVLLLAFSIYQIFTAGLNLGSIPPIPPGTSIAEVLGIPLIQSVIGELLTILGGMGGGGMGIDPISILMTVLIWFVVPIVTVIVTAIIGAVVRPKE